MALKKVKGNFDRLFDKNLTDLIRGIRNNKENEARFISQCIEEIKMELKQDNISIKSNAIAKLTYLQMHGYDVSWAAFNVIEVMASTRFTDKRIGYLAASVCFNDRTDVLMLTTNMIRKELNSTNIYEAGVSLGGLACFITADLARDLANDIVTLLTSSKPYVRKRAVLLLYKVFLKYPDALRPTFPRLKEKLEDPDPGVQSAAVNVICELARKNPQNYLSLAPVFFKLMTTSSNNWMLIKIIKLFGALVPLEPRLEGKLLEPLTSLINSTSAMSLLYECINTVTAVLISVSSRGDHSASIQLCVQKLGGLIEDQDQNLKYLGLSALGKILITYPKAVQAHKDQVLQCLDDKDESIRLRALDLLYGMVSKKNIMEIVKKLMEHVDLAEGSNYRDELLSRIISICSHSNYQYITNFEWYVSVLVELTKVEGTRHGSLISHQMLDVAVRVESIRHFAVSQMALLIENAQLLLAGSVQQRSNMCEVLLSASWICGEYSQHLVNPQNCLECMLRTKVSLMPGHIQSSFVQNIGKLYSVLLSEAEKDEDWDKIYSLDNVMLSKLPQFEQTEHLEAQERACSLIQLMKLVDVVHRRQEKTASDVGLLFSGDLNPIAPKAQRKVPVPEGLNLDEWINDPPSESESEEELMEPSPAQDDQQYSYSHDSTPTTHSEGRKSLEPSKDDVRKLRDARKAEYETNPNYLKGSAPSPAKPRPKDIKLTKKISQESGAGAKLPDVVSLDLQSPLEIPGMVGLDQYMEQQERTLSWKAAKKEKRRKKKGKRAPSSSEEEDVVPEHVVNREDGEMPEGAKSTDDEREHEKGCDPFKALDINLDTPLRPDERLPELHHRITSPIDDPPPGRLKGSSKKKKTKKEKEGGEKRKKKEKVSNGVILKETSNGAGPQSGATPQDKLDDWLSPPTPPNPPTKPKKMTKSSGKKKGSKKHLSEAEKVASALVEEADSLQVVNRSDYEVASGVCTPSKNGGTPLRPTESPAPPMANMTSFKLLAANEHIKMTYETVVSGGDAQQVCVNVLFTNLTTNQIRQLQFTVLDSLNARLLRDASSPGNYAPAQGPVDVPLTLPPGLANEHQFRFSVNALNVSQKLRGTLTYMIQKDDGAFPDKVDFHLRLPCIAFTLPVTISGAAFSQLLSGGDLSHRGNVRFEARDSLEGVLSRLCFHAHFTVVEQLDTTASLYTQNIQAQPICLLLKFQANEVNIEGKSSDASFLSAVLQEIKDIFAESH